MKANQIWQAALGELQLQMTKATFDTWVKNTHVVSFEDGTFIIGVHNAFTKDWLENRLLTTVKRTLVGIVGRSVEVKFTVWAKEPPERPPMAHRLCSIPDIPLTLLLWAQTTGWLTLPRWPWPRNRLRLITPYSSTVGWD